MGQVYSNFMATFTVHSDSGAKENKICHSFHFSPSICHEVMGLDAMILDFWMLSFKLAFSLQMVTAAMKLKDTCSLEEKLWPTYTAY